MKVVYIITSRNESILHIGFTLHSMGIEGVMVPTDSFHTTCAYWEHKLDKWGFHERKDSYIARQSRQIMETIDREEPDAVLFVNTGNVRHIIDYVRDLPKRCYLSMYMVDSIQDNPQEVEFVDFPGNHLFVYEYGDVEYLQNFGVTATYCPVGYNADYLVTEREVKDLDVVFVGSPTGKRREYLHRLAQIGQERAWRMLFAGPFYEERYFWKKMAFRLKYPALYRYIRNGSQPPRKVAELYSRAKICLNIQGNAGGNLNPRTFEIMAAGGFELISRHSDYYGLIEPGKDFADFAGIDEMLAKTAYYLEHDEERRQIAASASKVVRGRLRMEDSLRQVLGLI